MSSPKGLGKGLDSLFDDVVLDKDQKEESSDYALVPIERLSPNPYQPRQEIREEDLEPLVHSITETGVLQPILVRRYGSAYQIIAGERRWQASKRAGLKVVPVRILDLPDEKLLEVALLENLHRKDLNVIEQGMALKKLIDEFSYTHEDLAKKVALDRSTITNFLRLLILPEDIQEDIRQGLLSAGHGRALLGLESEKEILYARDKIITNGWSVRKTEEYVRNFSKDEPLEKEKDPNLRDLEQRLTHRLGMRTSVSFSGKKGHVKLYFSSLNEFDRLLELFEKTGKNI